MSEQIRIPFSPPDITEAEIAEVADALRSGWITTGPKTKQLERELAAFLGTSRVTCLGSATAALECALRALGIGPGDEVITSAYTYTASCSPICHVGATPVLCDVAPGSYEMDYAQLEKLITPRTKAIIPVDLGRRHVRLRCAVRRHRRLRRRFHARKRPPGGHRPHRRGHRRGACPLAACATASAQARLPTLPRSASMR